MHQYNSTRVQKSTGFSLLELLAVVTILGIIAVVVIPRISTNRKTSMRSVALQGQTEIRLAIERYYFDKGVLPPDANAFMHDTQYCDPGLTSNNFDAFTDAGYWYTYNASTGSFQITLNGQPIS